MPDIPVPPGNNPDDEVTLPDSIAEDSVSAEPVVPVAWQPGDVILGLYEVRELLGSGGMGQVHRVHHRRWGVDVAVKSPHVHIVTNSHGRSAFVREAETWVGLGLHPHVISCHYVRTLGGLPRVFAEWVDGGSLSDWIRSGALYAGSASDTVARVLDIAIQMAWGLDFAHQHRLVHQDVKPANVLMTSDGTAKVTDFGLARVAVPTDGSSVSAVSVEGMTPLYRSPEQAMSGFVTRRTDIWSWGVAVLEMLTGAPVWAVGELAGEALTAALASPATFRIVPPPAFADTLRAVLQRDPEKRPDSLGRVADNLREAFARSLSRPHERARPEALDLIADALNNRALSLIDLGRSGESEALWAEALRHDPKHRESLSNRTIMAFRTGTPDHLLIAELTALRAAHNDSGEAAQALGLLHLERRDTASAASLLEDARAGRPSHEIDAALAAITRVDVPRCTSEFPVNDQNWHERLAALSADGRRLVASEDSRIVVRDAADLNIELAAFPLDSTITALSMTPDAGWALVATTSGALFLHDLRSGTSRVLQASNRQKTASEIRLLEEQLGPFKDAFGEEPRRPDRSAFVSIAIDGRGERALTVRQTPGRSGHDGRRIAAPQYALHSWNLRTAESRQLDAGKDGNHRIAMSADGRFAVGSTQRWSAPTCRPKVWELDDDGLSTHPRQLDFLDQECDAAIAGHLALAVNWRMVTLVDCRDGTQLWSREWKPPAGDRVAVAMSLDGRRAVVSYSQRRSKGLKSWFVGELQVWDLVSGRVIRTIQTDSDVCTVSLNNDGSRMLTFDRSGWLRVWHLPLAWTPIVELLLSRPIEANVQRIAQKQRATLHAQCEAAIAREDYSTALQRARRVTAIRGQERTAASVKLWARLYRHCRRTSVRATWPIRVLAKSTSPRLSPDGSFIASARDRAIVLEDVETGSVRRTIDEVPTRVGALAISSNGRFVAASDFNEPLGPREPRAEIWVWDAATGARLHRTTGLLFRQIDDFAISFDGRHADLRIGGIVSLGHDPIRSEWPGAALWRRFGAADRERDRTADGRWRMRIENEALSVIDDTRNEPHVLVPSGVRAAEISSDGRWLLIAGSDYSWTVHHVDWELEAREAADFDEAALSLMFEFQQLRAGSSFGRELLPALSAKEFDDLLMKLACAGFGWLRPAGVRRVLDTMSSSG